MTDRQDLIDGFVKTRKIDLVLEVTTSHHKGRHGVEIRVDSRSGDGSHSWIKISNKLKNSSETWRKEHMSVTTSRILQRVRGDPLPNRDGNRHQLHRHLQHLRLSRCNSDNGSTSNRGHTTQKALKLQRRWTLCFDKGLHLEKKMERLKSGGWYQCLRQDLQHLRTGQVDCVQDTWKGGGPKKRFQYCVHRNSLDTILYLRAIQGHAGGNPVDPTLQDNEHVMILNDFLDYICHVRNSHDLHSIINSGLPAGGKDT